MEVAGEDVSGGDHHQRSQGPIGWVAGCRSAPQPCSRRTTLGEGRQEGRVVRRRSACPGAARAGWSVLDRAGGHAAGRPTLPLTRQAAGRRTLPRPTRRAGGQAAGRRTLAVAGPTRRAGRHATRRPILPPPRPTRRAGGDPGAVGGDLVATTGGLGQRRKRGRIQPLAVLAALPGRPCTAQAQRRRACRIRPHRVGPGRGSRLSRGWHTSATKQRMGGLLGGRR